MLGGNISSDISATIRPFSNPSSSNNTTAIPSQLQQDRPIPIRNEALAHVKALGMPHLEATTQEVINKTRQPLFIPESEMGPTPDQLAEAHRIYMVLSQVLENVSQRDSTFSIKGEPIVIMEVEVSKDLKQARVYWTLPFSVMQYPKDVVSKVSDKMQEILQRKGGKLQRLVHAQLRSYYPPKIRFVPSPDDVFQQDVQEMAKKRNKRSRK